MSGPTAESILNNFKRALRDDPSNAKRATIEAIRLWFGSGLGATDLPEDFERVPFEWIERGIAQTEQSRARRESGVDQQQLRFLAQRLREAMKTQPQLRILRARLLALGGVELVAPCGLDPDLDLILENGSLGLGRVRVFPMDPSQCHRNTASLWLKKTLSLNAIVTGYALSADGLWRQHSWGRDKSGIVETTSVRAMYFGIPLTGAAADRFAAPYRVRAAQRRSSVMIDPLLKVEQR